MCEMSEKQYVSMFDQFNAYAYMIRTTYDDYYARRVLGWIRRYCNEKIENDELANAFYESLYSMYNERFNQTID